MNVIVTDAGFSVDDWTGRFRQAGETAANDCGSAVDLPSNTDPADLGKYADAPMIRIDFPSFADGRGFTLAAMLRRAGYAGRLRARGHVLADQYAMVRRAGFDEVEIDTAMAARQPEEQWQARSDWQNHHYQARLRG